MKPGGVSTSGLLTLRDAQAMALDLPAGCLVATAAGRNWIGFSAPASGRRMASRRPRASHASAPTMGVLIAGQPPATYREHNGLASAAYVRQPTMRYMPTVSLPWPV
jgi:hypothetical protein